MLFKHWIRTLDFPTESGWKWDSSILFITIPCEHTKFHVPFLKVLREGARFWWFFWCPAKNPREKRHLAQPLLHALHNSHKYILCLHLYFVLHLITALRQSWTSDGFCRETQLAPGKGTLQAQWCLRASLPASWCLNPSGSKWYSNLIKPQPDRPQVAVRAYLCYYI